MRGEKCRNSLKKTLLSCVFLAVLSVFGVLSCFSSSAHASFAARAMTYRMALYNENNNEWAYFTFGSYGSISAGWSAQRMSLQNTTSQTFTHTVGDTIVVSGTILSLFDYTSASGSINAPLSMTCPQFYDERITTTDCQIAVDSDVSSGQHFQTISYVATGVATDTFTTSNITMSISLRNNHTQGIRIYAIAPVLSSMAGGAIDTAQALSQLVASNSSILSAIQSFNTDMTTILPQIKNNIITAIENNSLSASDISSAVESGQNASREDEKAEIQDAADEAETQAETSGAESEAQGTTLVSIISGFISAISSPSGGSCIIDVDLSLYYGGTHNYVNLCSLDPPSGITTVLSIILIVFVVSACVHVIQSMLALYREFQS